MNVVLSPEASRTNLHYEQHCQLLTMGDRDRPIETNGLVGLSLSMNPFEVIRVNHAENVDAR
jgi:hypothetical protein